MTRDIEIKNKLTVTRMERGGGNGGKQGKGHQGNNTLLTKEENINSLWNSFRKETFYPFLGVHGDNFDSKKKDQKSILITCIYLISTYFLNQF